MATKTTVPTLADLYAQFQTQEEEARAANLERQRRIENIFETQLGMYAPGGPFEKAALAELAKTKIRDVSAAEQRDISSGLFGLRSRGTEWESAVGMPSRLRLEDIMQQRRSAVLSSQAGFLERIQTPYPDYSALIQAFAAQGSMGGIVGGYTSGGATTGSGKPYQSIESWMDETFGDVGTRGPSGSGIVVAKGEPETPKQPGDPYTAKWYEQKRLENQAKLAKQYEEGTSYAQLQGTFTPEQLAYATDPSVSQFTPEQLEAATTTTTQQASESDETSTTPRPANYLAVQAMSLPTYKEYKAFAESHGLKAGSKAEWEAVKKRV